MLAAGLTGASGQVSREHTYPAGWSLVSVPLRPVDPDPAAVFAALPAPLRVYDYLGGHVVGLGEPGLRNVTPGRSFWLLLQAPVTVTVSGALTNLGAPFRLPLLPGWNGIATPWLGAVEWSDARVSVARGSEVRTLAEAVAAGWIVGTLGDFDPAGGVFASVEPNATPPGLMQPWRGYALYSHVVAELVLAPPPPDTTPPTLDFTGLPEGAAITAPTEIVGSVGDETLVEWRLEVAPAGTGAFTLLARGESPVVDATLATLDPTLLLNGLYELRLVATDAAGQSSFVTRNVVVKENLKVGHFTVAFRDLEVPVAGLPITVIRTYDSRDKGRGDFGIGWRVGLSSLRLSENGKLGLNWESTRTGVIIPNYCLQPSRAHVVTVTLPEGRVLEFEPVLTPSCQQVLPVQQTTVTFRPLPGSVGTLAALDSADAFVLGGQPGPVQLVSIDTIEILDPTLYRLTLPEGESYVIHQQLGVQSLTDRNGNTLTVGAGGIVHSSGKGVAFARDGLGRITSITDPAGNAMTYAYDAAGDLVTFTDREGHDTTYEYDPTHRLTEIRDPTGARALRNEYDENGRLVRHIDAEGRVTEFTHSIGTRQELITDRLGRVRLLEYDARGNVVRETDQNGKVTERTFDARGNRLTERNPLGETRTFTYDAQDNLTSETDALGKVTTYTYNARGQRLTATDARGNLTTFAYDARGNVASVTDALDRVTVYTYAPSGSLLTETDPLGCLTRYEYDTVGNLTREIDALGRETSYTYDANGNRLTDTRTRTVGGVPETLVVTRTYDRLDRVTEVRQPDGSTTRTVYDEAGRKSEGIDALGRTTTFVYDDIGRLIRREYPDGTADEQGYDAEGRRTSFQDRGGRTTTVTYDPLGRPLRTTFADGAFVTTAYDDAGRAVSETDARGHATVYEHDAAGRRTRATDPLGGVTVTTWDEVGNEVAVRDPRGQTTTYVYDELNRRTRTVFPDGTTEITAYDALGRVTAVTDQAGRTTSFTYDCLGRLTKVTDALGQETTYTYDEVGNRVAQRDASGHVTTTDHDRAGRPVRRTLPLGQFETRAYDAAGNLTALTDFGGATATYTYDAADRLTARNNPDGSGAAFTYTPAGMRATATDARGVTQYAYDARDRLSRVTYPDGRRLDYAYDLHGNRTRLTATIGASILESTYAYDDANRLSGAVDPLGRSYLRTHDAGGKPLSQSYPNGALTSFTHDTLGRLTALGTTRAGATLQSYAYTLGPAGHRTRVTEADGAVRSYAYDPLHRLTDETVTGGAADYVKSFAHDPVGNRLAQTDTRTGPLAYSYDDRDRLLTAGPATYAWDANGTLQARGGGAPAALAWDFDGRLRQVTTPGAVVRHAYDADGNRVRTEVTPANGPPVATDYLVDPSSPLSQVVADSSAGAVATYYFRGEGLLALVRGSGTRFVHQDGLGSTRRLSDEAGNLTDAYTFTAFGELLDHTGTDPNSHLFAGEPRDPDTGYAYHRARWLDAEVGRFLSRDPFAGELERPSTLHPYLYTHGDPVNSIDPTGEMEFSLAGISVSLNIQGNLRSISGIQGRAALEGVKRQLFSKIPQTARTLKLAKNRIPGNEVHHIIEQRFWRSNPALRQIFQHVDDIPGVSLPQAEHRIITELWRQALPRAAPGGPTPVYTLEQIMGAAQKVYASRPELLNAVVRTLMQGLL